MSEALSEEPSGAPPTVHERKRRDILRGAAKVFSRRGFSAGTTKEVAAEVGLSQPAIYHYVGSKDELLRQIALQVDHDMLSALDAADANASPAQQLRAIIEAFVAAVIENQETFAVYWKEIDSSFPEDLRAAIAKDERAFMARVAKLVAALQEDGVFPRDAPTTIVTEAVIGMAVWMYRWYRPGRGLDAAGIARVFCDLVGLEDAP